MVRDVCAGVCAGSISGAALLVGYFVPGVYPQ